jgi:hypothetical protein
MVQPFLPPNSDTPMHQADTKSPDAVKPPVPTSIPVEKLVESLKPGPQLQIESGGYSATGGGGSSGGGGGSSSGVSTTGP